VDFPIGSPRPAVIENVVGPRPELPERWEFLARNVSDVELYYDRVSLAQRSERVRVWIYSRFPETLMAGEAAFDASQALFEFRCAQQEFRLNQYLLLRGQEVIGSNGSVSSGRWSAVAPDSIAESLLTSVCNEFSTSEDEAMSATPQSDESGGAAPDDASSESSSDDSGAGSGRESD
jgi:hypothetical protein